MFFFSAPPPHKRQRVRTLRPRVLHGNTHHHWYVPLKRAGAWIVIIFVCWGGVMEGVHERGFNFSLPASHARRRSWVGGFRCLGEKRAPSLAPLHIETDGTHV
jgi:hypothetical protein